MFFSSLDLQAQRAKWLQSELVSADVVNQIKYVLDNDNHEMRDSLRKFCSQDVFAPRYNVLRLSCVFIFIFTLLVWFRLRCMKSEKSP